MLFPTIIIFSMATCDLVYTVILNIRMFIGPKDRPEPRFLTYMKLVDLVVEVLFGDGILIYRCWVIYNNNHFIVILPIILWITSAGCGALACYMVARSPREPTLLSKSLLPFIPTMLILTLVTNIITTSCVVYRIWSVGKLPLYRLPGNPNLSRVNRILIESGLVYTSAIAALLGLYFTSSNAVIPVSDAIVQLTGITFNVVIIRGKLDGSAFWTSDTYSAEAENHAIPDLLPLSVIQDRSKKGPRDLEAGPRPFRLDVNITPVSSSQVTPTSNHSRSEVFWAL